MGLCIYLEWDDMDENQPIEPGFRLDQGHVGYLRASHLMPNEHDLYHEIFHDRPTHDFLSDENEFIMQTLVDDYLEKAVYMLRAVVAQSIFDFYALGKQKQRLGLNPRVEFR